MQQSAEEPRSCYADFNLGSATISIDCDRYRMVIPTDTVEKAVISPITDLIVQLELSTPLDLEGEGARLVLLQFPLDSSVPSILRQMLGQRLKMVEKRQGPASARVSTYYTTEEDLVTILMVSFSYPLSVFMPSENSEFHLGQWSVERHRGSVIMAAHGVQTSG